ncbi:MAG: hypothetical protein IOD15_10955 [Phycisphaerales bacterium]|jgi:hypothetical protein|nr:hypothetical protein [Phycisphaerales bacterium]
MRSPRLVLPLVASLLCGLLLSSLLALGSALAPRSWFITPGQRASSPAFTAIGDATLRYSLRNNWLFERVSGEVEPLRTTPTFRSAFAPPGVARFTDAVRARPRALPYWSVAHSLPQHPVGWVVKETAAGWPFRAFSAGSVVPPGAGLLDVDDPKVQAAGGLWIIDLLQAGSISVFRSGDTFVAQVPWATALPVLPLRPIWAGLLANVAIFGALIFFGGTSVRLVILAFRPRSTAEAEVPTGASAAA